MTKKNSIYIHICMSWWRYEWNHFMIAIMMHHILLVNWQVSSTLWLAVAGLDTFTFVAFTRGNPHAALLDAPHVWPYAHVLSQRHAICRDVQLGTPKSMHIHPPGINNATILYSCGTRVGVWTEETQRRDETVPWAFRAPPVPNVTIQAACVFKNVVM